VHTFKTFFWPAEFIEAEVFFEWKLNITLVPPPELKIVNLPPYLKEDIVH